MKFRSDGQFTIANDIVHRSTVSHSVALAVAAAVPIQWLK